VRLGHDIWLFSLALLCYCHVLWVKLFLLLLHVHFIVAFIAPKVFTAGDIFSEQTKNREDHVGSYLASYAFELGQAYVRLFSEGHIEDRVHFFQGVDSLLKVLSTPTFLGISTLANEIGVLYDGHARDYSGDVCLRDQLVSVEVIDLEDKVNLLFNR
jgi:hypothetical protein